MSNVFYFIHVATDIIPFSSRHVWKCTNCQLNYDNDQIEFALIDILNRQSMGYIIQDLQCLKCAEVKQDNIIARCPCSGYFKTIIPRDTLVRTLKIFRSISIKCEMPILAESIRFMLTNVN